MNPLDAIAALQPQAQPTPAPAVPSAQAAAPTAPYFLYPPGTAEAIKANPDQAADILKKTAVGVPTDPVQINRMTTREGYELPSQVPGGTAGVQSAIDYRNLIQENEGISGLLKTIAESAASTATLGVTPWLERALDISTPEAMGVRQELHPVGQFAGAALGIAAPMGLEKYLGEAGLDLAAKVAGGAPGVIAKGGRAIAEGTADAINPVTATSRLLTGVGANALGGIAEGGVYGYGQHIGDEAADPKATVEGALMHGGMNAILTGAALGGGLGAAGGLIGAGARELAPKAVSWLTDLETNGYKKAWGLSDEAVKNAGLPDVGTIIKNARNTVLSDDSPIAGPFTSPATMAANAAKLIAEQKPILSQAEAGSAAFKQAATMVERGTQMQRVAELAQAAREAAAETPVKESSDLGKLGAVIGSGALAHPGHAAIGYGTGLLADMAKGVIRERLPSGSVQAYLAGAGRETAENLAAAGKAEQARWAARAELNSSHSQQPNWSPNDPRWATLRTFEQHEREQINKIPSGIGAVATGEAAKTGARKEEAAAAPLQTTGTPQGGSNALEEASMTRLDNAHKAELEQRSDWQQAGFGYSPTPGGFLPGMMAPLKPDTAERVAAFATADKIAQRTTKSIESSVKGILDGERAPWFKPPESKDILTSIKDVSTLANDPDSLLKRITQSTAGIHEHIPAVSREAGETIGKAVQYLSANAPQWKQPYGLEEAIPPTRSDLLTFQRKVEAVTDPMSIIKQGLEQDTAQAIQTVYPGLWTQVQIAVATQFAKRNQDQPLPSSVQRQLGLILGQMTTPTLDPMVTQLNMAAIQGMKSPANGGLGAGRPKASARQSSKTMTPAERISAFPSLQPLRTY